MLNTKKHFLLGNTNATYVTNGLPYCTNPCISVFNNIGNDEMALIFDSIKMQ